MKLNKGEREMVDKYTVKTSRGSVRFNSVSEPIEGIPVGYVRDGADVAELARLRESNARLLEALKAIRDSRPGTVQGERIAIAAIRREEGN